MLKDIPQTMACPVCKTQIPFTIGGLLRGERFTCPGCSAVISLPTGSQPKVQAAIDELDRLQSMRQKTTGTDMKG
ncbi:MAG TPA: hypothetical protein H9966_05860 [Candidatus Prevotella avicola]|uniref:Uncharacterized protein n=1 Tax=Candidatus Prevotella avicola TaxID=2838738 RepID=A0A9D2JW12_9BACT|nr:hypothetical protein [Candidatus Prevotella avicola]